MTADASDFDAYAILDERQVADADAIKSSYRRLALKYHPDKNGGDAAQFKRVAVAQDSE